MPYENDATIDIPRLLDNTSVSHVHYLPEAGSTNEVAMQRAAVVPDDQSELVLASRQTAGKGRGENRWFSTEGSLTFSLITPVLPIEPGQTPQVSLVAGLAASQAVEAHAPGALVQVKWPNDVYVNGRKTVGVLIEVPKQNAARFVIGVGINVNNSLAAAPDDVRPMAISLADAAGGPLDATALLVDYLNRQDEGLAMLARRDPLLPKFWRGCSYLTGRRVRVVQPNGAIEGRVRDIADDGALLVETTAGVTACYGGVVEHFD